VGEADGYVVQVVKHTLVEVVVGGSAGPERVGLGVIPDFSGHYAVPALNPAASGGDGALNVRLRVLRHGSVCYQVRKHVYVKALRVIFQIASVRHGDYVVLIDAIAVQQGGAAERAVYAALTGEVDAVELFRP